MAGLLKTMNIGSQALFASRQGVDTASHNIANAHTEGFSRQRVNLQTRHPNLQRGIIVGNGVFAKNITRSHDQFLEKQINKANQDFGLAEGRNESLKNLESIFSPELSSTVADELTNFYNSLQNLSNSPEELGVRTHVRESGNSVISSFKRVEDSLYDAKSILNQKIEKNAQDITRKLDRISELNMAIGDMETGRPDYIANDLRDEQEKLVREISQDVDISYYQDKNGLLTVRGPRDTLLVEGKFSAKLVVESSADGASGKVFFVDPEGSTKVDVTQKVKNGRMASMIDVRDNVISGLIDDNELMANNFMNEFNAVHRRGFGINDSREISGRDFFESSGEKGNVIRTMKLTDSVVDSVDAIAAASTPNAPGDNVIANELLRLKDAKIMRDGTFTITDYYSDFVGTLAVDIVNSEQQKGAETIVVDDLEARRQSVAGVSLDEEAINLLKWQANFAASSKVITTTDEMLETVLNLKR